MTTSTPKNFYGYDIDTTDVLSTSIHFAPSRDIAPNECVKVGAGYCFPRKVVKAGERGTFYIEGNFIVNCDSRYELHDHETAALDPSSGLVVPANTPNAYGKFEIDIVCPSEGGKPAFAIGYFSQPVKE